MGLGNVGWSGMVLILVALLLVFGPSKLPEIGKAFGKSLREFRTATKGITEEPFGEVNTPTPQPRSVEPITILTERGPLSGTASSNTNSASEAEKVPL